jgi:hypothetical protein
MQFYNIYFFQLTEIIQFITKKKYLEYSQTVAGGKVKRHVKPCWTQHMRRCT